MKLPYALWRVQQRPSWHKLYINDLRGARGPQLDLILNRLSGDWMIKKTTLRWPHQIIAVLIADDEDYLLVKCAFLLYDREYRGKQNWARYYPIDKWRSKGRLIPTATRQPSPMGA